MTQTQQVSWFKKYRPHTFDDFEGEFADAAVKRLSDPERRPQVIMLYGIYGCGKTTAARLISGFYSCEDLTEKGTPCGKCAGCQRLQALIENGEDDEACESVQEINGSSVNKVEDIRRIMSESMMTLPTFSRYKVFIFDECHRITPEAQNALLKILEDIPPYLVIIFATTEHEKMLPTVLSRCQLTVEVRKQTLKGMTNILTRIAEKEGLAVEKRALQLIAKKGNRIPRDCINLLEDIAATYDGRVTSANVLVRTGEVDTAVYFSFIKAAHTGLLDVLTFISDFSQGDISYQKFITGLSRFVMEAVYVRMGISAEDYETSYLKTLKQLFVLYKAEEFHKLLKLIDSAAKRTPAELGSTELTLSVLALNIGDITKVQVAVSGDCVKEHASSENSQGAGKYVERDNKLEKEKAAIPQGEVSLEDFMSDLGAVSYGE